MIVLLTSLFLLFRWANRFLSIASWEPQGGTDILDWLRK